MSRGRAFIASACFCIAVPASAQPNEDINKLIEVFASVCLENAGNVTAQIAGASDFFSGPTQESQRVIAFRSANQRLEISPKDRSCFVTSSVSSDTSFGFALSAVRDKLGADEGQQLNDPGSRGWLLAAGEEEFVMALSVGVTDGQNLATLLIQPRAALSENE